MNLPLRSPGAHSCCQKVMGNGYAENRKIRKGRKNRSRGKKIEELGRNMRYVVIGKVLKNTSNSSSTSRRIETYS